MKKSQTRARMAAAKKLVGIPNHVRLTTPTALRQAISECRRLDIATRKGRGSIEQEREWLPRVTALGEAREMFRGELSRALKREEGPRNANARIAVSPEGGLKALGGYWLPAVQSVFRKWSPSLGESVALDCFLKASRAVLHRGDVLKLLPRARWQVTLEFAAALASVVCDRTRPEAWLLSMPGIHAADAERGYEGWQEISERIRGNGGPIFPEKLLAATAKRMKITTPKEQARDFRKYMKRAGHPL
jgi:hypothetical protein